MLSWTKQMLCWRNCWACHCFKSAWLISNIFSSLVTCASLKGKKIKCSSLNCQVNNVLKLSWIATRLCRDAVRFGVTWLFRRELTDSQVSDFVCCWFLKNIEETMASKETFLMLMPWTTWTRPCPSSNWTGPKVLAEGYLLSYSGQGLWHCSAAVSQAVGILVESLKLWAYWWRACQGVLRAWPRASALFCSWGGR